MDMAAIHIENTEFQTKIIFSGAKRPLWYINSTEGKLKEIEATKKSVGSRLANDIVFEETIIFLPPESLLYVSSDGYYDQNDYQRNSYGKKKLKELLEKNYTLPLAEQKNILENELDTFSKNTFQRDDVLVMGFKL